MISIIIPVLNGEAFLTNCYSSIVDQELVNEIIFIDNGSTDGSIQIIESFCKNDSRVRLLRCSTRGISAALNAGLNFASNEFIARLDVDDEMLEERCRLQQDFMIKNSLDLCGTQIQKVDTAGKTLGLTSKKKSFNIFKEFSYTNPIYHPSVMYRKSAVLRSGGYQSKFDGAEDLDLWLRMITHYKAEVMEECLVKYRIHSQQVTVMGNSFPIEFRVRISFFFKSFRLVFLRSFALFSLINLLKALYAGLMVFSVTKRFHKAIRRCL